jgi:hypothetical protein
LPKRQRVPYSPSELAAMEVIQLPPGCVYLLDALGFRVYLLHLF